MEENRLPAIWDAIIPYSFSPVYYCVARLAAARGHSPPNPTPPSASGFGRFTTYAEIERAARLVIDRLGSSALQSS